MSDAFLAPRLNPVVLGIVKAALPVMFERYAGGIEVRISDADLDRLRTLKRRRVLLCPNHPTHFDPMIIMDVSKRLDEDFNFVAAREVFDRWRKWHGKVLQRLGCYSLTRGAVDRESFAMTQKILADGKNWLVIFIEGEVSMENDTALPFEAGVMSLALRVQDKLCDKGEGPPLYVVPVGMKTFYKPGLETAIDAALRRLEETVGIAVGGAGGAVGGISWESLRQRIRGVGSALLTAVEKTYLLPPKPADTIDARMNALKQRLLAKIEAHLDLTPAADASVLDRVRAAKNRMDRIVHAYADADEKVSAYEERLLKLRRQTFAEFYADLGRLVNFLTLRGDYLDHATPERFAEVIIRLEHEILGAPRLVYPRTTHIGIGAIRDLRDTLPAFRKDKRTAFTALTHDLEAEMIALLRPTAP
ncbi:MAG TPA: 1-acyl-sn-glycerol-3-phosphate acyltransferase [Phycisphaerae bacterium]|nr:1-acyl-sn-glycerol-3-phosphate acyltransferase [Phycisphaerae bacterium]